MRGEERENESMEGERGEGGGDTNTVLGECEKRYHQHIETGKVKQEHPTANERETNMQFSLAKYVNFLATL